MTKRPPPSAAARTIGAVLAIIAVIVSVVVADNFTPYFALTLADPADRLPLLGLVVLFVLIGVLAYRFATRLAALLIPRAHSVARAAVPSDLVAAYLRDVDFPCPVCRYNLRGLQQPACPECNSPVRLAMVSADASVTAERFGLTLAWLLVALLCSSLVSLVTLRWIIAGLQSASAFGPSPGLDPWAIIAIAYASVPLISAVTCLVRLVLLFFARGEKRPRWARSTVLTLAIIGSGWMIGLALLTLPLMMFLL